VPDHAEFMDVMAEEFNAQSDVNVTLDWTSIGYQEMHDQLLIALQTGTGAPDLVDIEISQFGTLTRGEVALHDLSDIVDPVRGDLVEERLAPYQVEGVPYGVDYHLGAAVTYWNTAITDAAGVDIDAIETWDDYVEAGRQILDETGVPLVSLEVQSPHTVRPFLLVNGGGLYDENNELILDSPENAEALQRLQDLAEEGLAIPAPGGHHHDPVFFECAQALGAEPLREEHGRPLGGSAPDDSRAAGKGAPAVGR
jgi:arabinosaccharide transport system substrate-binding protein